MEWIGCGHRCGVAGIREIGMWSDGIGTRAIFAT